MTNTSIAMCCNVYNDANAIRGLLETSSPFFDELFVVHSGPQGTLSNDGTIEICESFGVKLVFDDIEKGYGIIRSRLIHECGCDWAFILDADERFFPTIPLMHCEGEENYQLGGPPPNLKVTKKSDIVNQGLLIRELIAKEEYMAIRTTRRHWWDFKMNQPCMNWLRDPDHQLRIVRNTPDVGYLHEQKMHERLIDFRTKGEPKSYRQEGIYSPFHDHFHMFYRNTQKGKKEANEANYARLSSGEPMIP